MRLSHKRLHFNVLDLHVYLPCNTIQCIDMKEKQVNQVASNCRTMHCIQNYLLLRGALLCVLTLSCLLCHYSMSG